MMSSEDITKVMKIFIKGKRELEFFDADTNKWNLYECSDMQKFIKDINNNIEFRRSKKKLCSYENKAEVLDAIKEHGDILIDVNFLSCKEKIINVLDDCVEMVMLANDGSIASNSHFPTFQELADRDLWFFEDGKPFGVLR